MPDSTKAKGEYSLGVHNIKMKDTLKGEIRPARETRDFTAIGCPQKQKGHDL